jgi:rubrerythrin
MITEQEKVLEALQTALLMENDGKECYLQAAAGSANEAGRKLLKSLAEEEDIHRNKLETIYNAISANKSWPAISFDIGRGARIRSAFAGTCEIIGVNVHGVATELDVLKTALEKEKKSYDFYERQAKQASYEVERDFYEKIAAEEREHELALLDYYEYLIDPAGWFVKTEHPSLDGG